MAPVMFEPFSTSCSREVHVGGSPAAWRPQNVQRSEERKPTEGFEVSEASMRCLFRVDARGGPGGDCFAPPIRLCDDAVLRWRSDVSNR
jgi:hypothetical protein